MPEAWVPAREIEEVFVSEKLFTSFDEKHSATEERFVAVARVKRKYVFVVFTFRSFEGKNLVRPVSARYMHKKEIRRYEEKDSGFTN